MYKCFPVMSILTQSQLSSAISYKRIRIPSNKTREKLNLFICITAKTTIVILIIPNE